VPDVRRPTARTPTRAAPSFARSTVILAAVLVALLPACSATGADEQQRSAGQNGFVAGTGSLTLVPPAERVPAPSAQGTKLGGKGTISTDQYDGKVVVLNVWGSWCNPCRYEAHDLQAASVETADVAQFLGLNTRDTDPAPALAFVRAFGITYPSIYDPTGSVLLRFADQLPPTLIPSTLVIDAQGRIAARVVGTISESTLVDLVSDVAEGR
jgi:thiol-disulfide isomerase/thioredoxin